MQPGLSKRIQGGVSDGIIVDDHPKHRGIDYDKYTDPDRLRIDTDPRDRGSKWLVAVTLEERYEIIRQTLENHEVKLGDSRRTFRSIQQPNSIGVSNGKLVNTVEVRFDGRRAHGYPCGP